MDLAFAAISFYLDIDPDIPPRHLFKSPSIHSKPDMAAALSKTEQPPAGAK